MTDKIHTGLSEQEIAAINSWLDSSSVGSMPVERPTVAYIGFLGEGGSEGGSLLGEAPRLSETTRRRYQEKAAKAARKKEGYEKRKLPVGKFHHQKKRATKNRAAKARWARTPLQSLTFGYGSWEISQEEWDRWLGPFWKEYPAERLHIKRKWGHGTKRSPYRIWHLKLFYQHAGKPRLLWDGAFLEDLYLSSPNSLDLQLAYQGAELFGLEASPDKELSVSTDVLVVR